MAKVRRSKTGSAPSKKTVRKKGKAGGASLVKVSLPTEPTTPMSSIDDYSILIHGEKKIGKTTLAVQAPEVLLLTFDPIQKSMALLQRHVADWKEVLGYVKLLESKTKNKKFPYSRVVIDGVDIMYDRCQRYVCAKLGIEHPTDAGYGKGWDSLKQEFAHVVDRLLNLPCGVWWISHSKWTEVETRRGDEISKLVPTLKAAAEEIIVGKVDGWFAYDYVGSQRVLIIQGDERTGAGHRMDEDDNNPHFRTPSGDRVSEISMGSSAKQGYANLVAAFDNEQTEPRVQEGGRTKKRQTKKKKKTSRRKS